jgi:nitrate reductase NapE component
MSWSKFHFNCRFLSQKLSEEVGFEKAKELLSTKYSNHQIGGDLKESSVENNLYKKIILETDPTKLHTLFSVYGKLNLSWDLSALTKLKNIRNYLFVLFTVFLFLSSIYKFFVLPAFIDIFSQMDVPITTVLERFNTIWLVSISLMFLVSVIILMFYSFVDQIGKKEINSNTSLFSTFFIPVKILNTLKHIEALSNAPIENQVNEFSTEQIEIYKNFKSDNLDTASELQVLLDASRASLLKIINLQITKLLAIFSIVVVGSIGYLVWSLYQPIFALGMII